MDHRIIEERAKRQAELASNLPESVQFAIFTVLPNIVNGAHWGFTDLDSIKSVKDALVADKNVSVRKITNGYLVDVPPEYLLRAVAAVDKSLVTPRDLEKMQRGLSEGLLSFEKYIKKDRPEAYNGMTVGIYCINDVSAISHKGVRYPSFRVDMRNVLRLLQEYRYTIKVGDTWMKPAEASKSPNLWSSLYASPTGTGAFITIKK